MKLKETMDGHTDTSDHNSLLEHIVYWPACKGHLIRALYKTYNSEKIHDTKISFFTAEQK
jgi:hypothetical protein